MPGFRFHDLRHCAITQLAENGASDLTIMAIAGQAEMTAETSVTVNSVLPGPTRIEGVSRFLQDLAKAQGTDIATVEKEFFLSLGPLLAVAAICRSRRDGDYGRVCLEPACIGNE